jgi:hypothetical protein
MGSAAAGGVRPVAGVATPRRESQGDGQGRPAAGTAGRAAPSAALIQVQRPSPDSDVAPGPFEAPPFARPGAGRTPAGLLPVGHAAEADTGGPTGASRLSELVALAYRRQGAAPPVYPAAPALFRFWI